MKRWALIFVHLSGLAVEHIADSEDQCHQIGAVLYEQFKVAHMCAEVDTELLLDQAILSLEAPLLTSDYVNAARKAAATGDDDETDMDLRDSAE